MKKQEAVPPAAKVEQAPEEVSEIIQDAQTKVFTKMPRATNQAISL
ncbi:hypothetical protein [Metabacillus idriensis]|nr:hypothetical protein [Metabacillus idriensis]